MLLNTDYGRAPATSVSTHNPRTSAFYLWFILEYTLLFAAVWFVSHAVLYFNGKTTLYWDDYPFIMRASRLKVSYYPPCCTED